MERCAPKKLREAVVKPCAPRKAPPDFAMGLIAAKPVKPCDGGVFGPLNLLLKKERRAPGLRFGACGQGGKRLLKPVRGWAMSRFRAAARAPGKSALISLLL